MGKSWVWHAWIEKMGEWFRNFWLARKLLQVYSLMWWILMVMNRLGLDWNRMELDE